MAHNPQITVTGDGVSSWFGFMESVAGAASLVSTSSTQIVYEDPATGHQIVLTGSFALNGSADSIGGTVTGFQLLLDADANPATVGDKILVAEGSGLDLPQDAFEFVVAGGGSPADLRAFFSLDDHYVHLGSADSDGMDGFFGADTMAGGAGNDLLHGLQGDDNISGGPGNDIIIGGIDDDALGGGLGSDMLYGEQGNDNLAGGAGDDVLGGGEGNDLIGGGDGIDTLFGEEDNDRLFGGADNDTLHGGTGNDRMFGATGDDILFGQAGDDVLYGGLGADRLFGSAGADRLFGQAGDDDLFGSTERDLLNGASGNDALSGGQDDDILVGGAGDDFLSGGTGNDVLNGGAGDDDLYGHQGADRFVFNDTGSDPLNPERDAIHDWDDGFDQIHLAASLQGTVTIAYGDFDGDADTDDTLITFGSDAANEVMVEDTADVTFEDIFFT